MEHGSTLRRMAGLLAAGGGRDRGRRLSCTRTRASPTRCSTQAAQYARVRTEIRRLDNRAELLTEQYDQVVWQLGVLRRRMRIATHRLIARAGQSSRYEQGILAELLIVEQYKGGDPRTIEIVLSAVVALPGHRRHGSEAAPVDTAVSDTVEAIDAARIAIAARAAQRSPPPR